ncbi:MAG TPA: RAMP superfamily CRISPR-associated protein, partial [Flavisolibacter sp.]|nr:RAMP superfamily CRISPR-associated protein [Flavisolibacter sp.]
IPGSSIKGTIRSILGKYLLKQTKQHQFNDRALFGNISNNFIRLQVSDVEINTIGGIYPFKTFSGDVKDDIINVYNKLKYEGIGMWKHEQKGGHGTDFDETGFVTYFRVAAKV